VKIPTSVVLAATGCLALSGCPSKTVQEGAASADAGNSAQCFADRKEVEAALEAYTMLERKPPVNEAALVPDYLLAESQLMDIDANGNVVAAPGSGCA
jgi:hypothetical protein